MPYRVGTKDVSKELDRLTEASIDVNKQLEAIENSLLGIQGKTLEEQKLYIASSDYLKQRGYELRKTLRQHNVIRHNLLRLKKAQDRAQIKRLIRSGR